MKIIFSHIKKQNRLIAKLCAAVLILFLISGAKLCHAQLRGNHILGNNGLHAGTQSSPSVSLSVPFYWYDATKLINSKGEVINNFPNTTVFMTGINASIVTNLKILNANYGAGVFVSFMSNTIESDIMQLDIPFGFTDMYIQPIQLGWHTKKADFTAGYGVYIPTGNYKFGEINNQGLGMWGHEISGGTTWYLNTKKTINFSSIVSYETHSRKKDTTMKTGDLVTAEGGFAKTFFKKQPGSSRPMELNVGVIYYMQFKLTDDELPPGSRVYSITKDHVYAAGIEGSAIFPKAGSSVSFRWLGELGAINRFQGCTYIITLKQPLWRSKNKEEISTNTYPFRHSVKSEPALKNKTKQL
jgi:hypothetical protein